MTTAHQECQSVPPTGPTATASTSDMTIHHNVQDVCRSPASHHQTYNASDPSSQAASLDLRTAESVSPLDSTQACHHGELLPDRISGISEDQPLGTLTFASDRVEDHIPPVPSEVASQAAAADPSDRILTGGAESTQPPSPASSLTVQPAADVHEESETIQDSSKISPRPPISESLGIWACVTLGGGTALTLAVLGFLVFLWAGEGPAGGERATYVWRKIMLSESWPAQTITICAVVVRTIAAAQAAICTSLVAALLLERRSLPLSKAVPVSIKRGVNDGPFNLVRDLLAWKIFRRLFCVEMALLILLTMVTFGIQFTSTLLLSGFDTTTLIEFPQQLHHNVILSAEAADNSTGLNSFSQFPPSYALFGELETSDSPEPNARGVSDTGVQLRSFVPFLKEERTKLRAYKGPAFSQKTQIMCMRPSMDAQVTLDTEVAELGSMPFSTISGTILYEKTFEDSGLNGGALCSSVTHADGNHQTACLPRNFTCTLPLNSNGTVSTSSVIALCHPPTTMTGYTGSRSSGQVEMWNASSPLWSANANPWVYLTFSTNLSVGAVQQELDESKNSSISIATPVASSGEWNTYQLLPTMVLNVTLCFAGLGTEVYEVSLSTATDPREPEVRWDFTALEDGADPGQRFMGTTSSKLSFAERGILSIADVGHPSGIKDEDLTNSSRALWAGPFTFTGMFSGQGGGSWVMCNFCDFLGWAVPPDIASLFQRTIHTTDRAAWAIQNFLTTYTQSWYAQILPQFDVAADIDVTFSTQLRIPRHWGGLTAALVLVFTNLVCVWTLTALYVVHTRYSRQGNVWHTVAQILSENTRLVLDQSDQVKDEEVEKALKGNDYLVFIGQPKGSDKISVLRS